MSFPDNLVMFYESKLQSIAKRFEADTNSSERVDQFPKSKFRPRRNWPLLRQVNRLAFSLLARLWLVSQSY